MEDDYYSIESILSENQKIQCTFKVDIPDMGHLDGGKERDIKAMSKFISSLVHTVLLLNPLVFEFFESASDYADFTIPPPFSARVRNALNAEARSVRLSALVGQGGLWYGFGRMIMRLLNDAPAEEMSNVLAKTFRARLPEVIDQAQHFASIHASAAASGSGAHGGGDTAAMAFREGLDGTERECGCLGLSSPDTLRLMWLEIVFALAQESARRTKKWYETSDRGRR
ncbi:DNA replication complex GINS protein PSF3 [Grifola frondosa]|uniref:DNA replication complex GINS protein PSF3 n=1 Tax=Grifola frondosa TaxID=5627 RepID=A0A1C7M4Z9_GRIFR|nr:DNA replication complex GINS protein PSF3 [Grifola frondosa]